ncbi:MAG: hypothetical protein K5888_03140 [Lachnospiraceae bacterium]|nr:hypothetical protein [Lachnospiraceae bacterium]
MKITKSIAAILIVILICLISILIITPVTTDADNHRQTVEQLDNEIENVLKLAGGATVVSAAVSLLPGDACTPISEQFAELGKYFIVILSALYFEKYFVTLSGYVSFAFLIPVACILFCAGAFFLKDRLKEISLKLMICALAIYFLIPVSVKASQVIYNNYQSNIEQTLDDANKISIIDEDESGVDKFLSWIENVSGTVIDYVTGLLSRFIEAIAVMLVTSCLLPVIVLLFFVWLIKLLFNFDIVQIPK